MNVGSTHIGTRAQSYALAASQAARPTALAVAEAARANWGQTQTMAALDRMNVQPARRVEPSVKVIETPAEIRSKVMAERGVDQLELLRLGPQARLEAEVSIDRETAARAHKARSEGLGTLVDLKV